MIRNMNVVQTTILANCHLHFSVPLKQDPVRPRRLPLVREKLGKVTGPLCFQLLHH